MMARICTLQHFFVFILSVLFIATAIPFSSAVKAEGDSTDESGNSVAHAQELHSLRDNIASIKSLLQERTFDLAPSSYPSLPLNQPFAAISYKLEGLEHLAYFHLGDPHSEQAMLSAFVDEVIRKRLQELGLSDEIRVLAAPPPLKKPSGECGQLNLVFSFAVHRAEQTGEEIVVINLVAWQPAGVRDSVGTMTCLDKDAPPRVRLDATRLLMLPTSSKQTAESYRFVLLSILDQALLRRLIASNPKALETVQSWVQ